VNGVENEPGVTPRHWEKTLFLVKAAPLAPRRGLGGRETARGSVQCWSSGWSRHVVFTMIARGTSSRVGPYVSNKLCYKTDCFFWNFKMLQINICTYIFICKASPTRALSGGLMRVRPGFEAGATADFFGHRHIWECLYTMELGFTMLCFFNFYFFRVMLWDSRNLG
jgi:hypothetical protein